VVARNLRTPVGELDLICRDGDAWVFVEVKTRSSRAQGGALWAVPKAKQHRVMRVARHFLTTRKLYGRVACRFDVVLINADTVPCEITHVTDAFRMEPNGPFT